VRRNEYLFLLCTPRAFANRWIQVANPSLAALFSRPVAHQLADRAPIELAALLFDQVAQLLVLLA
jgi:hypothetical protein